MKAVTVVAILKNKVNTLQMLGFGSNLLLLVALTVEAVDSVLRCGRNTANKCCTIQSVQLFYCFSYFLAPLLRQIVELGRSGFV